MELDFQNGMIVGLLVGVLVVFVIFFYAGYITGFVPLTLDSCDCGFVARSTKYSIVGDDEFSGGGSLSSDFKVKLRNEENQAASFKVFRRCNTATSSELISSEEKFLQPDSVGEFRLDYDVGWFEDWRCVLDSVKSEVIQGCEKL